MKKLKVLLGIGIAVAVVASGVYWGLPALNRFQKDGRCVVSGLSQSVHVMRDEKGMAYIRSQDLLDAIEAQGFTTAQDRLFQMQLARLVAQGRISELIGEKGKSIDVRNRTIGMHRLAKKHARILDRRTRLFFQRYADGVNAFITSCADRHPVEFKAAGIRPELWTVQDCLSVMYFMAWITSANASSEIVAQILVDRVGPELAEQMFTLNINPDEPADRARGANPPHLSIAGLHFASDSSILGLLAASPDGLGSNNWVVSGERSRSGKPIVANDPHLDARILPGVWYPLGIITPDLRAVGVTIPGIPGMVIGRTSHLAMGVTNAYGDCQDLYVETVDPQDPGRYKEGAVSIPFRVEYETLRIRDKQAPGGYREEKLQLRFTHRGPVVSGILPGLRNDKEITLRWAAAETMEPRVGLEEALTARSLREFRSALRLLNFIVLNWVFADEAGNIGWHVSGKLPIRSQKDSVVPYVVADGSDNWIGWIPFDEMPHAKNPGRGWLGTCNHKTVGADYPYYYSSYFAPSYRYVRLKEILDRGGVKSPEDHWQYSRDTTNVMARAIAPGITRALLAGEDTRAMGEILKSWNFRDDADSAAPTIFQAVYRSFVESLFESNLGPVDAQFVFDEGYFWQESVQRMVLSGKSRWIDRALTVKKLASVDDLFRVAARRAKDELGRSAGSDPRDWGWGKLHTIQFVNPLRRNGFGTSLLGKGPYPMGGSRETLCCAWYSYAKPFSVILSASLRMVADLGDPDKVMAVIPGGVSGRTFDPHMKDQVEAYMNGTPVYWWLSDKAIRDHCKHTLTLEPK